MLNNSEYPRLSCLNHESVAHLLRIVQSYNRISMATILMELMCCNRYRVQDSVYPSAIARVLECNQTELHGYNLAPSYRLSHAIALRSNYEHVLFLLEPIMLQPGSRGLGRGAWAGLQLTRLSKLDGTGWLGH